MFERPPFDRIVLDAQNDHAKIDVVLLEFPKRQVPNPQPSSGSLEVRRLSQPSIRYEVLWSSIAEVQLYEQLILAEALELTKAGKSLAAFRSLQFLHEHYPDLDGLALASEQYVKREALDQFSASQFDESVPL